ncbi:MAG: hypothetical protein AMXMBFR58_34790 [Phycisphaerae bacterium]
MSRSTRPRRGRGAAIVAVVVVIAALHLAVMGTLQSSTDDAQTAAFRIETTRAFYATDSCVMVCRRLLSSEVWTPAEGDEIDFGNATASYVDVPAEGEEGNLVIEGRSGDATRRVRALLTR